jgi:hypothetical protein
LKLGEKQWNLKELSEIFSHKAQTRVQAEPGSHLFHILAFYDDSSEPQARFPFRVNSAAELGGGATEEPTERGVKAQTMRHAEAAFQFAFKHSQHLFEIMLEQNRDLTRHIHNLASENADAIRLAKETLLAKAANDHELRMKEMAFIRNLRREDQLMKYLPAITNTIAGKEIFPQGTQDTAIIDLLLDSMGEEQIKMLSTILPAEAQAIIAARAAEYFKAKREARDLAESAAHSALNGGSGIDHDLGDAK